MRLLLKSFVALLLCLSAAFPHLAFSQTSAPVRHEVIRFSARTTRSGELFTPTTGKPSSWPGILVVHDAAGLTDEIRTEATTLAAHGYLVLAVNLYDDRSVSSAEDVQAKWRSLDRKTVKATCNGTISYLQSWIADPEQVGAVGWGEGGSLVLELASDEMETHLKAAVDRGGPSPLNDTTPKQLSKRLLIIPPTELNDASTLRFLDSHLKPKS